jgi:ABC-type dipeptide/oligopeptide/nickel transport system permease component
VIVYALRRLVAIPLVLIATFVPALLLVHAAPNGPFDPFRKLPAPVEASLAGACDIDAPIVAHMLAATIAWVRFDVDACTGRSLRNDEPVLDVVAAAVPHTLRLAGTALLLAVLAGVLIGALLVRIERMAAARNTALPIGAGLAILEAVPAFVLAPLLVLIGALALGLFAPARTTGLFIPAGALALAFAATTARVTKAALRTPDAVTRLRADLSRGLSSRRAALRALRLALLPVVAGLGPMASAVIMGGIAVERVFDLPGLGPLVLEAADGRDYNVLLGGALAYATLVLVASLLADLLYGVLDPRVRGAR